jgi:DNA-binding transcriptional regulator LsrR (DeoR family)
VAEQSVESAYENARLISRVLSLYYRADATQSDIARQLGISTPKVNRLLKMARRQGMVRISLHIPFQQLFDLENQLEETFLIPEVVVLPSSTGDTLASPSALGAAGARYLLEHLQDGDVIAIGGGTTIHALVEAVKPQRAYRVDVVPVVGGVQGRVTTDVNFLAAQLAERLGGRAFQLHSPAFAESQQQRQTLLNMKPIKDILNIARRASIALLGIGTVDPETSRFVQFTALSAEEMKQIADLYHGIGELLAIIYDRTGEPCAQPYADRVVGLTMEELRAIPLRIGVAGSLGKAAAIHGALCGGYLHTLITDETAAQGVLELQAIPQGS